MIDHFNKTKQNKRKIKKKEISYLTAACSSIYCRRCRCRPTRPSPECSGKSQHEPEHVHDGHGQQHVAGVLDSFAASFRVLIEIF